MNELQAAEWNGASGVRWLSNQTRFDQVLALLGEAALRAAAPRAGEQVLDVGCGAGHTSIELARHVQPQGHVTGVDVSKPLIERARERSTGIVGIEFQLGDASHHPFLPESFDLLFSRFGVMFFENPVAAFRHLRHALKPNGRLAFVCWRGMGENDWATLPTKVLGDSLPLQWPSDPEAPGPFSFGDWYRIERTLGSAGFTDVGIEAADVALNFGTGSTQDLAANDALELMREFSPLSRMLDGQDPESRQRANERIHAALAARYRDGSIDMTAAVWIVTASKGGAT